MALRFSVLGPLTVLRDGEPVELATKLRTLLATLLVRAGQPVPLHILADRLWGEEPPVNVRGSLQTYITRLRTALGDDGQVVQTVPGGYLIQADAEQLDLAAFRELVARADVEAGHDQAEAALLHQALELWNEMPLSDLAPGSVSSQDLPALVETRMSVLERRIDVDLRLGLHTRLVPELRALTAEHPLRERLWAQLMLALYRCGRQADALSAYESVRRLLAAELGLDPGPELRELQQAVLAGSDRLAPLEQEAAPEPRWPVHHQLPLEAPYFTGREELVSQVEKLLTDPSEGVPIVAVSGPPGAGKSALALHVAHRIGTAFPDGQWYVHLAGAGERPREPADVLAELLVTSGVPRAEVPDGLDARSALLRSRLAGRQVLVVLDDAAKAEQVRPLLPGTPQSAVLITSRSALGGLTALAGAHRLVIGQLEPEESALLLARLLGGRPGDGADALAELCGHLPLALRIAASNLAVGPGMEWGHYLDSLRAGDRLAQLAVAGDPDAAVRNAFDRSYLALDDGTARLFRLLGVVPGPDFTAEAAAALTSSADAARQLELLAEANLVQRYRPGRFQFHDLLRLYAAELASADPVDRDAARQRWFDAYLHKTMAAMQVYGPQKLRLPSKVTVAVPADLDAGAAQAWLDAERSNLVAAVLDAEAHGELESAWCLADQLGGYFSERGHHADWHAVIDAGLGAAEAAGNAQAMAAMYRARGSSLKNVGRTAEGRDFLVEALRLYRAAGDFRGEHSVTNLLGIAAAHLGDSVGALDWFRQTAEAARRSSNPRAMVMATDNLAAILHEIGRVDEALALALDAQAQHVALGDGPGQNSTQHVLAVLHQDRGELDEALALITDEIAAVHRSGRRQGEAMSTEALATIHRDRGEFEQAEKVARDALELARGLGDVRIECHVEATLGDALSGQGRYDDAIDRFHIALALARQVGAREVEVRALMGLALARLGLGAIDLALADAEQAVRECETLQMAVLLGRTLTALATTQHAAGQPTAAEASARRAIKIQRETGAHLYLTTAQSALTTIRP
ncbi:BTAD domain-containing putative transcriptional regulator [Kribbella sp. NPDC050124]|uniref:AfsR/SARP family transcriptional regulator n=1 Tax=Kribbella sp. NPDC050124 TaxID=3364114 RepID=UPI0037AEA050